MDEHVYRTLEKYTEDHPRCSGKQLLAYMKEKYKITTSKKEANRLKSDSIHIINPERDSIVFDETHKSEIKKGVKIMTPGRSQQADDQRSKNKPKKYV